MLNKKINKNKTMMLMMVFSILLTFVSVSKVSAKTEAYGSFSLEPHLPENQINQNVGYFDLLMTEDMGQRISFDIVNDGDDTMVATIEFNNATTGLNAEKTYTEGVEPDKSMVIPMLDMATIETKNVEVKARSRETVYIDIKAPSNPFDGVSLGGIRVTANKETKDNKENKNGFVIENRISYVIALQVRMNDNATNRNLNYVKSSAELIDLKPQFVSYIQNDQPVVMNNVSLEGKVKNNVGEIVAEINKEDGGIFPNSEFMISYALLNNQIEAGDYTIDLKITSDEDIWQWQEVIALEDDIAKDLNENTLKPVKNNTLFYVIIILIIVIITLLIILLKKKRKIEIEG